MTISNAMGTSGGTVATRWRHVPWLTLLLMLAIAATYLWQGLEIGRFDDFSAGDLIVLGGNLPQLSLGSEPWRLVTAIFLHQSPLHILSNLVALLFLGGTLEILTARWKWLFFLVAGGLVSSLASACIHFDNVHTNLLGMTSRTLFVSVGASGVIMTFAGAIVVLGLLAQLASDGKKLDPLLRGALVFVAINLLYGFVESGVDNSAHLSGLIFGVLSGVILLLPAARSVPKYLLAASGSTVIMVLGALALWQMVPQGESRTELVKMAMTQAQELQQAHQQAQALRAEDAHPLHYVDKTKAKGKVIAIPGVTRLVPAADPDKLYVAANNTSSRILEYDLGTGEIVRTVVDIPYEEGTFWGCPATKCAGVGISDLVINKAGTKAFASTLLRGKVSRVDLATGKINYSVTTGTFPSRLLLHDGRLYAYDRMDNTLSVIDVASGSLSKTIAIPGKTNDRLAYYGSNYSYRWPTGQMLALADSGQSLYLQTPDRRAVKVSLADLTATVLPIKKVRAVSRGGDGMVWLLTGQGVYAVNELSSPTYQIRYRLSDFDDRPHYSDLADTDDVFVAVNGGSPLILHVFGTTLLGISAASERIRRVWPVTMPKHDAFALEMLDAGHCYVRGRHVTRVFSLDQSLAPGRMADFYRAQLMVVRARWDSMSPAEQSRRMLNRMREQSLSPPPPPPPPPGA